jgi:hypothetical protein
LLREIEDPALLDIERQDVDDELGLGLGFLNAVIQPPEEEYGQSDNNDYDNNLVKLRECRAFHGSS